MNMDTNKHTRASLYLFAAQYNYTKNWVFALRACLGFVCEHLTKQSNSNSQVLAVPVRIRDVDNYFECSPYTFFFLPFHSLSLSVAFE